jgi:hypothetical protein
MAYQETAPRIVVHKGGDVWRGPRKRDGS